MTVGRSGSNAGPQVHALLVGVGSYPYLRDGERYTPGAHPRGGDFQQLSSPPYSADALAEWLISVQSRETQTPLGSLELLVSTPPGFTPRSASSSVVARAATFVEIRAAFERWRHRCDEDEANIALFYFCGHGFALGQQNLVLLPEDFGENPNAFFENGIDLATSVDAASEFRAATQLFFIDACRVPLNTAGEGRRGRGLGQARHPELDHDRDLAIVYSTRHGHQAFGDEGTPTTFTRALVQALDGLGAVPPCGHRSSGWHIDLESLPRAVAKLVPWNSRTSEEQKASCYVSGSGLAGRPIRVLQTPPEVPFRLHIHPAEATSTAELCLTPHNPAFPILRRPHPQYELWEGAVTADNYKVSATFTRGDFHDAHVYRSFLPPCAEHAVEVVAADETVERERGS